MKIRSALPVVVSALGLTALALPSAAKDALPYADELDTCVAAVNARLDLSDARRVRHTVTREKRTGIGYVLSIETAVYAGDNQRRYAAYCVARGTAEPVKFTLSEL